MFDKEEYRKRRAEGKRGQGDEQTETFTKTPGLGGNRSAYRKKSRARYYKDADDHTGTPFTSKRAKHKRRSNRNHQGLEFQPMYDPSVSGHERVFRQRVKSKRYNISKES